MEFRTLKADEIECRVQSVSDKGCILLLYKDARADMTLLDETVGAENWQRKHEVVNGNLFCNVGIKVGDDWVWKQDVGVESNTEAEKGQASDSFKRACVNWGIGRELYSSPFIWIDAENVNITTGKNGKPATYDRFTVRSIGYDDKRRIASLVITNDKKHKAVFSYGAGNAPQPVEETSTPENNPQQEQALEEAKLRAKVLKYVNDCKMPKENIEKLCKCYKVDSLQNMSADSCRKYIAFLKSKGVEIDE